MQLPGSLQPVQHSMAAQQLPAMSSSSGQSPLLRSQLAGLLEQRAEPTLRNLSPLYLPQRTLLDLVRLDQQLRGWCPRRAKCALMFVSNCSKDHQPQCWRCCRRRSGAVAGAWGAGAPEAWRELQPASGPQR